MKPQYRYVRAGSHGKKPRFLSIQQNCLFLPWFLFWYGKPFGFRGQGFRRALGGCKSIGRVALTLFYYRLCSPNADSVIELPVFGQLCLKVQNGYKVFDLRRQVVVKVFSQEINPAIVRYEIEQVRRVGTHRFAPSVRRWNVEERWYEEDYVNGYTTSQESLVPLIADMMLVVPPREVGTLAYAHNLGAAMWSERGKLSDRQLDTAHANKIRGFVRAVIDQLESAGERQIYLVFSHGDFSPRHVLTTGHSSVAVDWEAVGSRSALFDLFDAYFQRCFHGYTVVGMSAEVGNAILRLQSLLGSNAGADSCKLSESLSSQRVYLLIYYIERFCSYLKTGKQLTESGLDRISRVIDAFERYQGTLMVGSKKATVKPEAISEGGDVAASI